MSTSNSFFALLNIALPGNSKEANRVHYGLIADEKISKVDIARDNEWMQEYYIIYNSYILDDTESAGIKD